MSRKLKGDLKRRSGFLEGLPRPRGEPGNRFQPACGTSPTAPGTGPKRRRPPLRRRAEIDEYERSPSRCLLSKKVQPKGNVAQATRNFLSISFVWGKRGR